MSLLFQAIRHNNLDLFQKLIHEPNYNVNETERYFGDTLLHDASYYNQIIIINILLNFGININTLNKYNETPLFYSRNNYEILELLLENGADPNIQNNYGDTLLHIICLNTNINDYKLIEKLLDYDANPFLKTKENETVVDLARRLKKQSISDFITFYLKREELWFLWELDM